MGCALPCKRCKKTTYLSFKTYSSTGEWWIACDQCGQIGPVKMSQPEAGEAWNEQQRDLFEPDQRTTVP